MKNFTYLFIIFFIISNCSFNKVTKKHGVRNLEKKQIKLVINESNKNDIKKILGPPSSTSTFDNDLWIFIEREITHERILKLGKEKLVKNNVLFLEIDSKGILIKKNFFDINEMNETEIKWFVYFYKLRALPVVRMHCKT